MPKSSGDRYLVLSDLHLGIKESAINNPCIADSLIQYIHANGPWRALIFNGDLLDLNMSSFQLSVEGGVLDKVNVRGIRQLLSEFQKAGPGAKAVRNWIYIPGNHDYLVWTLLANKKIYVDRLASGRRLNIRRAGLKEGEWKKGTAFISGVFPEEIRKKVTVKYPDHVIQHNSGVIVITHGHYLDPKQTLFTRLKELVHETGDQKKAIEKMYVETDRFQAMANILTYASEFQKYVNYLLRTGRFAKNVGAVLRDYFGPVRRSPGLAVSPLRGEHINTGQLRAAEFYLRFFRNYAEAPDFFVYGHTHRQGMSSTGKIQRHKRLYPDKTFQVYNTGAFLSRGDTAASFIRIDAPASGKLKIIPVKIGKQGKVVI